MNMMQKMLLAGAACGVMVTGARAMVINNGGSGVTSATAIDPAGGDSITYSNPNWSAAFTKISTGTETYSSRTASQILSKTGVRVLNFESANGFGTVSHNMGYGANGSVFTSGTSSIAPYTTDDAVSSIVMAGGYQIGLSVNNYNTTTKKLSDAVNGSGAFLVGDNSTTPVMTSGTQGLTFGPTANNRGVTLTFQTDVSAVSLVFNCGNTGGTSPTYLIVYFDANGNALASYQQGVGNTVAVLVGMESSAANIRSVWIGETNNTTNTGIVIDDVAFVAVPEPATAGLLAGTGIGAMALLGRRK